MVQDVGKVAVQDKAEAARRKAQTKAKALAKAGKTPAEVLMAPPAQSPQERLQSGRPPSRTLVVCPLAVVRSRLSKACRSGCHFASLQVQEEAAAIWDWPCWPGCMLSRQRTLCWRHGHYHPWVLG